MKVIDYMLDHIGKPVNLGFKSSFVYCDIVTEDICAELAHLSADWLNHEIDMLHDSEKKRDRFITLGVNKYADNEITRWACKHRTKDDPFPDCPREVKKRIKSQYYAAIKSLNKEITNYKKAIKTFKSFGECEVKEVYTSTADFKTLIVIGKGNKYVIGKYWTREEYLADHGKEVFFNE